MADNETPENYDRIENDFNYHAPDDEKQELHDEIRETLKGTAHYFDELLPNGREKSIVFTKLEETMFWANAAIARSKSV